MAVQMPPITNELRAACAAYRAAQAHTASIRPTVEAYKRELMLAHGLTYGADFGELAGQPITDLAHIWMADDQQHAAWCAALDVAHQEHGFTVESLGQCPLLVAECEEIKAARRVAEAAEYFSHVSADRATGSLKFREYVELTVKFVEGVTR